MIVCPPSVFCKCSFVHRAPARGRTLDQFGHTNSLIHKVAWLPYIWQ